jgi:hypothetical protein
MTVSRNLTPTSTRPPLWSCDQSSWLQNGDEFYFLWGINWIYICYVEESRPPLWSSGQSSWLQIQRSRFDSRLYQIYWEIVGLERGPLSLVSTIEELLGRKCSGSGLESREYCRRDPSRWPRGTLYPQRLALTSLTTGGRSVGTVRSRTQATEYALISQILPCFWEHNAILPVSIALGIILRENTFAEWNRKHSRGPVIEIRSF